LDKGFVKQENSLGCGQSRGPDGPTLLATARRKSSAGPPLEIIIKRSMRDVKGANSLVLFRPWAFGLLPTRLNVTDV